jgi:phosphoribosylformimino-5-aminoimidazole carboxamide ribotide isomerase
VQIIPAVDLKNGKCVRLTQGKQEEETIFSEEPVSVALKWQEKGAKILHIVDLDGAFKGTPQNLKIVEEMLKVLEIPLQLGGGIRDFPTIEKVLSLGVERVILGTSAVNSEDLVKEACLKFGERIAVGIDAYEGKVSIKGWQEDTAKEVTLLAEEMERLGVRWLIYTDIKRDGMLKGPDIEGIKKIARRIDISLIASGGISSLEDIKKIKDLESYGVYGAIIGKALYTGAIDLEEAIEIGQG